MKNQNSQTKEITVRVMNPLTKEQAKQKIKEMNKMFKVMYGDYSNEKA